MKLCLFTAFFTCFLIFWEYIPLFFKLEDIETDGLSDNEWKLFKKGLFMVAIIWGVGIAIKLFVSAVDKWMKRSEYIQRRNQIYLGLCIIAVLSIYGKIQVMQGKNVDKFFVFIIVNIFCASYAIFITPNEKHCEWKQKSGKVYEFFLLILVCMHTYILYLSIIESTRHKDLRNFVFVQLSFSLICASSTCDILAILMGKLKLKEEAKEEEVELETVKVEKRPSASTQPVAHVGYVQVKEEIPFSTRVSNAVRDFVRLFRGNQK